MPDAPKPVRRQQSRTADRRASIEAIAMNLFAEQGYNGVSLRDIGQHAEVKLGSLFYLYQEKQALYDRVVEQSIEHFGSRIVEAVQAAEGAQAQLRSLIRVLVREHAGESPQGQIVAREMAEPQSGRLAILGRTMFRQLRDVLNPAVLALSARPLTDEGADRLTGQLINMIYAATRSQGMYLGAFGLEAKDADRLSADLEDLILNGLLGSARR